MRCKLDRGCFTLAFHDLLFELFIFIITYQENIGNIQAVIRHSEVMLYL